MLALILDGTHLLLEDCETYCEKDLHKLTAKYKFSGGTVLKLEFEGDRKLVTRIRPTFYNGLEKETTLNHVVLLGSRLTSGEASFGADLAMVRVLEQGNYWGRVVPIVIAAEPIRWSL